MAPATHFTESWFFEGSSLLKGDREDAVTGILDSPWRTTVVSRAVKAFAFVKGVGEDDGLPPTDVPARSSLQLLLALSARLEGEVLLEAAVEVVGLASGKRPNPDSFLQALLSSPSLQPLQAFFKESAQRVTRWLLLLQDDGATLGKPEDGRLDEAVGRSGDSGSVVAALFIPPFRGKDTEGSSGPGDACTVTDADGP